MADFFQKAERPPVSRPRRLGQILLLFLLVGLAALFVEHWRGERALRAWKERMIARGEILDPIKLWPAPSTDAATFSNQLAAALGQLPKSLGKFEGRVCGMAHDESGQVGRGSRQPAPLTSDQDPPSTWQELNAALKEGEPGLRAIRQLMKNPPRAMEWEITKRLDMDRIPNFIGTRRSAQGLATAAINDLHRGNLADALENLEALQGCVRLNSDEPALVNFMMRVAVAGLGSDTGWDALQETGWTEPQLLRLQQACQANDLLPQMPKALAAERLARLHSINWLAAHSYQEWVDRYAPILKSFGAKPTEYEGARWASVWREWVFHPAWSYAWRAQEELVYLRYSQDELDIVRESVRRGAWMYLNTRQTALRDNYARPAAEWRFYQSLPMLDWCSVIIGSNPVDRPACPYPNYSKAWLATARNLSQHQMMITTIALKRYQLHHGKLPAELTALIPDYLKDLPHDLVDGQPLRYRLNANGSFTLYSIGEDATDDGGDARPPEANSGRRQEGFGAGRDWVWPQSAAPVKQPKT